MSDECGGGSGAQREAGEGWIQDGGRGAAADSDQNIIGWPDMCLDPMGMVWMKDLMARKPKPTNTSPGLIYMLNGATQHSYTDPFDTTSPAIPISPHWMILWPFDAKAAGLGTVMRDAGSPGRRTPTYTLLARRGRGRNITPVTARCGP